MGEVLKMEEKNDRFQDLIEYYFASCRELDISPVVLLEKFCPIVFCAHCEMFMRDTNKTIEETRQYLEMGLERHSKVVALSALKAFDKRFKNEQ